LSIKIGLIGVSGSSSDMRDLLDREAGDPHAAQAVDISATRPKTLAAMTAVLGGLDTLVFTAGIASIHRPTAGGLPEIMNRA